MNLCYRINNSISIKVSGERQRGKGEEGTNFTQSFIDNP